MRRWKGGHAALALGSAWFALALMLPSPASAAFLPAIRQGVTVRVVSPAPATLGSDVSVRAIARLGDGRAAADIRLALYVDQSFVASLRTDPKGSVTFEVSGREVKVAGQHPIEVRFDGTALLRPARASTLLAVDPAQIRIATVPPVAGLKLRVGTRSTTTGDDGIAVAEVDKLGSYDVEPMLDEPVDPSVRLSFVRWADGVFTAVRRIDVRENASYVLGVRIAYRGSIHFVDLDGRPVDPSLIERVRATASNGSELVLTDFSEVWWDAGTAVSRTGGLTHTPTLWRMAEVAMAGTNVVNQGQQSFSPVIGADWRITLLLYDLSVRTEDAFLGGPAQGTLRLEHPNGATRSIELGADGTAEFPALPRGEYTLRLASDGIAPPTPVALSRSQTANIRVISRTDLVAGGAIAAVALAILIWIGRRQQVVKVAGAARRAMAFAANLVLAPFRFVVRSILRGIRLVRRVPADIAILLGRSLRLVPAPQSAVASDELGTVQHPGPVAMQAPAAASGSRRAGSPARLARLVLPGKRATDDRPSKVNRQGRGQTGSRQQEPSSTSAGPGEQRDPIPPAQASAVERPTSRRHACPRCGHPTGNSHLLCRRCRRDGQ